MGDKLQVNNRKLQFMYALMSQGSPYIARLTSDQKLKDFVVIHPNIHKCTFGFVPAEEQ